MESHSAAFNACPFPEVAEALRPYIKTRQDVDRIRHGLQSTLPLSPIHTAQTLPVENVDPSTLTGVRKAYWRALEAHRAAQSKYDSLKIELEQLAQVQSVPEHEVDDVEDPSALLTNDYMPLLRQREKHRKLTVIDKTATKINVTGGDALTDSFDKLTKRQIGELPVPPSTAAFIDRETGSSTEFDLTELKRAILVMKSRINEHKSSISETMESGVPADDPHAQLRGLQKAHSELTTWMETQLAMISDVNAPKENGASNGVVHANETNGNDSSVEIESLYETYLEARQRLLYSITKATPNGTDQNPFDNRQQRASEAPEVEPRITMSEILVPYLSDLMAVKENEQTLLHQGAYTRRLVASTESQMQAVLTRLAEESHLVEPGLRREAPHGIEWSRASEDAAGTTNKYALQRVASGKASIAAASTALETTRSIPTSLDSFLA